MREDRTTSGDCVYGVPNERPGKYVVAFFKPGYQPATLEQEVEEDGCHVVSVARTIELRR